MLLNNLYLKQCWPILLTHICVLPAQWLKQFFEVCHGKAFFNQYGGNPIMQKCILRAWLWRRETISTMSLNWSQSIIKMKYDLIFLDLDLNTKSTVPFMSYHYTVFLYIIIDTVTVWQKTWCSVYNVTLKNKSYLVNCKVFGMLIISNVYWFLTSNENNTFSYVWWQPCIYIAIHYRNVVNLKLLMYVEWPLRLTVNAVDVIWIYCPPVWKWCFISLSSCQSFS